MKGLRAAVAFLTPVGGAAVPTPAALVWFGPVGALIGLVVGGVWWLGGQVWPALVAAAVAVAVDLACTGMLHVDGLADSADGLLPPLPRDRRLEVMADPATGAFGVAAVVVVLVIRGAVFASIPSQPWVIAGLWCASRGAMVAIASVLPYARGAGLASAFLGDRGRAAAGVAVAAVIGVAAAVLGCPRPLLGALAVVGGVLGACVVAALARARIGGFTGDVLGAAGLVGETVALLVLAAQG